MTILKNLVKSLDGVRGGGGGGGDPMTFRVYLLAACGIQTLSDYVAN